MTKILIRELEELNQCQHFCENLKCSKKCCDIHSLCSHISLMKQQHAVILTILQTEIPAVLAGLQTHLLSTSFVNNKTAFLTYS
jgi:hypothetical protein